jgi:glycosyltransferase involved in cell wall biosynthesis
MRILQVVTLISPDGAYGGPARVALNQSAELIQQGHEVTVASTTRGYRVVPTVLDGVPVKLFPARTLIPGTGFAGMGSPAMTGWFRSNRKSFDIVHIHLARELAVLPMAVAARRYKLPYVLQTHGMVVPSNHPLAPPLDALWTRKVLRDAGAIFYLTPLERDQLLEVAGGFLRLTPLGNGVPDYPAAAQGPGLPEVLFAARMHPRKRPIAFVEMAKTLLNSGTDARFALVGPDEGEGAALREALKGDSRISWEGAVAPADVPRRMASASLYVLPSVREPYPMSVLEAMSVGLPVIVSSDCGLAQLVERARSGLVTNPQIPSLASAVESILADPTLARAMGERGRATVRTEFTMRTIGDRLVSAYTEVLERKR